MKRLNKILIATALTSAVAAGTFCTLIHDDAPVNAEGESTTVTITRNSYPSNAAAYNWYEWTSGDLSGEGYIYGTTKAAMQYNGSKTGRTVFSTTPTPSKIDTISIKQTTNDERYWALYASNTTFSESSGTSSGTKIGDSLAANMAGVSWTLTDSYTYFMLYLETTKASNLTEITVTYGGGGQQQDDDDDDPPTPVDGTKYELITSNDDLVANSNYIMVGLDGDTTYALKPYESGNNCKAATVNLKDDIVTLTGEEGVAELTLGGATGNWTLYDGAKYLYAAGGTGKNNYMKGAVNADNLNAQWTIDIADDGKATIITADTTVARNTIMYNSGSTLFSCYASGQKDIYLYKKVESSSMTATEWAQSFLDNVACDGGVTAPSVDKWNSTKTTYSNLEQNEKDRIAEDSSDITIQDMFARYNYILRKYGTDTYEDFLNTGVTKLSNRLTETDSTIAIKMVVGTMVLLTVNCLIWALRNKLRHN